MADSAAPLFEFSGEWPFDGQLRIGGHPVASVTEFEVRAAHDGVPVITLTLVDRGALKLLLDREAGDVRVTDATRDALMSLGWSPPSGK